MTYKRKEVIGDATQTFLGGKVELHSGDCRSVTAALPDASIDSVVTDPPYSLVSIVKRFWKEGSAPAKSNGATGVYARASSGFMGKRWDTGETAFAVEFWAQVLRVMKPGGHLVAFSGTRTYHRMACAIEDAGFEIRDQIGWCYGSGFPKSHNLDGEHEGWGTALKPAWEPICLARKPLIGTVAANVQKHGTGALNIDGCRIALNGDYKCAPNGRPSQTGLGGNYDPEKANHHSDVGRWPANLCHDGSEEVMACFPDSDGQQADISTTAPSAKTSSVYGKMNREGEASANRRYTDDGGTNFAALPGQRRGDSGSAARFFFTAKADSHDRIASKHPTVKPLDLMQWLCRLVTPKGGTVLDPFAGTGTTGEAAWREGFRAILIEREAEYQADIARRMDLADNPTKRAAVAKTKNNIADHGPLFSTDAAE